MSLIFIMFYGGFGTSWKQANPVAAKAVLLSTVGVFLTAAAVGIFCHLILHLDFWESMLIGSVISSTDAASVFSILRSKRLNLKYNTASMLEVESGSNDPCSYMLTMIVLTVMSGNFSGGELGWMIFSQVVFGVSVGVLVALASLIGGNGYLSTYIAGIILGNQSLNNKKSLVHFFDGITGLMQMLIFFCWAFWHFLRICRGSYSTRWQLQYF